MFAGTSCADITVRIISQPQWLRRHLNAHGDVSVDAIPPYISVKLWDESRRVHVFCPVPPPASLPHLLNAITNKWKVVSIVSIQSELKLGTPISGSCL